MTRKILLAGALVSAIFALGACESRIATRGNLPDPELLAEIKAGKSNREDVADMLGSPSSVAVFDEETWFYLSQKTETFAFFEPEVIERQVLVIKFKEDGMVSTINKLGLEDGRVVQLVGRETPTSGNEMNFIQQMLGNVGRFNK